MPVFFSSRISREEQIARTRRICYVYTKSNLEQTRLFQDNLKCSLEIDGNCIPVDGETVRGLLVLETLGEIKHVGIIILLKGISQWGTFKFAVVEKRERGLVTIPGNTVETHDLERRIDVSTLPIPFVTKDGKLIYKLEVYCKTMVGLRILVCKKSIRWLGKSVKANEQETTEVESEMKVEGKGSLFGLRKGKEVLIKWKVCKGAYEVGEDINVEMHCETKEKAGVNVEGTMELIQTVLYQQPTPDRLNMADRLKKNQLGKCVLGGKVAKWNNGEVFGGQIRVPRGITPSINFNLKNSISYAIIFKVRLKGESMREPENVKGELPVLIESGTIGSDDDSRELWNVSGENLSVSSVCEGTEVISLPARVKMQRSQSVNNISELKEATVENVDEGKISDCSRSSMFFKPLINCSLCSSGRSVLE